MNTREQWLEQASQILLNELISGATEIRDDLKVKLSVGFAPNTRAGSKTLGVCFKSSASTSGHNEIFVSPEIDDAGVVLGVLLHEIIHAVDDCKSGHKGDFARIAQTCGFSAPFAQFNPTAELADYLATVALDLGPLPHARMDLKLREKPGSRLVSCKCPCGFGFTASRLQIKAAEDANFGRLPCIVCGGDMTPLYKN